MNAKTMEGLAGAGTNWKLVNTPMRVYREARRRGDTAVMERAMGYASEFADKAEEYKAKAEKGMKEDAQKAREEAESELEKTIQKRKEEREKQEERIDKSRNAQTDAVTVEISEEGRALSADSNLEHAETGEADDAAV